MNPFVEKDIKTKQIKRIAFKLSSKLSKNFQFGEISSIIFTNDKNKNIELNAIEFNSNPYISQNGMKINPNEIVETCEFNITKEKLDQLINSNIFEIKINSANKNSRIIEKDISKNFTPNLKLFYDGYILK